MEKNNVKKKRGSVGWALGLSWLSTLLLAILAIFLMLLTTVCSEGFMRKQVTRSSFADYAYSYLYDNYVSYGASTGFDADVMTSTLSRDQINTDMEQAVTDLYAGNTAVNARENVKTDLNAVLVADLNSRGKDVTEDVASAVEIVADALERNGRIQDRNAHGRMFNMSRDHMRNCCIVLFQFKAGGVIALTLQDSIVKTGLYLPVFQKNFIQLVQSILFTFCFHVCNHTFRKKNISHSHLCSSPPFLLYRSAAFAPIQKYGCKGSGTLTPIYVASYVPTFWQNLILF